MCGNLLGHQADNRPNIQENKGQEQKKTQTPTPLETEERCMAISSDVRLAKVRPVKRWMTATAPCSTCVGV